MLVIGQSSKYQVEQPSGRIVTKHYDLSLYYLSDQTLPVWRNIGRLDTFSSLVSAYVSLRDELITNGSLLASQEAFSVRLYSVYRNGQNDRDFLLGRLARSVADS